ncbi:phosphatidylinositol 3 and 4-kinase-domain-containing protein [Hysterangium stoloniferum]|nr:phosphatidylinositol 3 and 4-kinase-domain-containing protein [Hysterangium stoloniferum]
MSPNRAHYQPLAQSVEGEELEQGDVGLHQPGSPPLGTKRKRPHIDLRTIDTAFKKWTENIAQKVKRKKKAGPIAQKLEIMHSVFGPEVQVPHNYSRPIKTLDHNPPMTHEKYMTMTDSVREAIVDGSHPKMISKGSSGSYFARAKVDGRLQTVGVFKPKDEEPYGRLNPKTTKWIHRQFRWIIPFGRSCLIPNLSYISEAAASLLDERLQLYIVPRTELVSFSSPAFFYDWLDRSAAKKGKPLPGKVGSLQCFLHGYQDASEFLRAHPLPGRSISDTFDDSTHRTGGASKRILAALQVLCGRTGEEELNDDDDNEDERIFGEHSSLGGGSERFHWTRLLQHEFREELEKLVILDVLMRNTDRGADNYMIKYCEGNHERALIDIAPSRSSTSLMPAMREIIGSDPRPPSSPSTVINVQPGPGLIRSFGQDHVATTSNTRGPHLHLAAIDNSLAFPHEHPKGWRSFTYGWLYLPVSVIGRPFSEKTRSHFLPLLTSKAWWEETTFELKKLFALDPDFHPKMFKRQMAVIKGQAWNIVQRACYSQDEGPLELTRRQKVLVWDDEVEVPVNEVPVDPFLSPILPSTMIHNNLDDRVQQVAPAERRLRSRSIGSYQFPPPRRRSTTDNSSGPGTRPVPFANKFQKINPGASGVRVLEHMERLDEVERGLKKLGMEQAVVEEDEGIEDDIGVGADINLARNIPENTSTHGDLMDHDLGDAESEHQVDALASSTISAPVLSGYVSDVDTDAGDYRTDPQDIHPETRSLLSHGRASSDYVRRSLDWIRPRNSASSSTTKTRTVIVERLETIDAKPFFGCW